MIKTRGSPAYLHSANHLAKAAGNSRLSVLRALPAIGWRHHGIGPFYVSLFTRYGRIPSEWGEYLVYSEFNPVLRRLNPLDVRIWVDDKRCCYHRCEGLELPMPGVLGAIDREAQSRYLGYRVQHTPGELDAAVRDSGLGELFFKLSHGTHGDHAFSLRVEGGRYELGGGCGRARHLLKHVRERLSGEQLYIVQSQLRNAETLREIRSEEGPSTVRVVTMIREGRIRIDAACLRIILGANVIDNLTSGPGANVVADMDTETGCLGENVCSVSALWHNMRTIDEYPETKHVLTGFRPPQRNEVMALVLRAQEKFAEVGTIG